MGWKEGGVTIITDEFGRQTKLKSYTCFHCSRVRHPKNEDGFGICTHCGRRICPHCVGKGCTPFNDLLDKAIQKQEALARYW